MRIISIVAILGLTTACTSENELRYTSTLQAETNGVALSEDGLDAYAAMSGTTCKVDTNFGCPTSDANLPTEEEKVVDFWNGRLLGASVEGVHTIEQEQWLPDFDLPIQDVISAKLTEEGTIVMSGRPDDVCIFTTDAWTFDLPGELCAESVVTDIDRSRGAIFAATDLGDVFRIDALGAELIREDADLVAVDPGRDLVLFANRGGREITAVDSSEELLWSVGTEGWIESVAVRGGRDLLLLLRDVEGGFGTVERRSLESGELIGSTSVPSIDGTLVVSDNGRTVGIVGLSEVNWYNLELPGDEPVIDETVETCMDMWDRGSGGWNLSIGD